MYPRGQAFCPHVGVTTARPQVPPPAAVASGRQQPGEPLREQTEALGGSLTSYWACRFRAFWLRKPKTLEKCSFRISLNTCGGNATGTDDCTDLDLPSSCLLGAVIAQGACSVVLAEKAEPVSMRTCPIPAVHPGVPSKLARWPSRWDSASPPSTRALSLVVAAAWEIVCGHLCAHLVLGIEQHLQALVRGCDFRAKVNTPFESRWDSSEDLQRSLPSPPFSELP